MKHEHLPPRNTKGGWTFCVKCRARIFVRQPVKQ